MLPTRLELRNFLAYRNPDPIHFDSVHLACLTGPNGAGKTSLLDAITWALWGKARTRSDDDLIYQGQTDMLVQLDFLQGEAKYRVVRKRQKGKTAPDSMFHHALQSFLAVEDEIFKTQNQNLWAFQPAHIRLKTPQNIREGILKIRAA